MIICTCASRSLLLYSRSNKSLRQEMILAVLVRFVDGGIEQFRVRVTSNTTERKALTAVLETLSDDQLSRVTEIQLNHAEKDSGTLVWLETSPTKGQYRVNRELQALQEAANEQLRAKAVEYSPDDVFDEKAVTRPPPANTHERVGPVFREL